MLLRLMGLLRGMLLGRNGLLEVVGGCVRFWNGC